MRVLANMPQHFKLLPESASVYCILAESGLHVGNLKLIGGMWKFKAIGYAASGQVIPGGGPLTDRHNTVFTTPDVNEISRIFC